MPRYLRMGRLELARRTSVFNLLPPLLAFRYAHLYNSLLLLSCDARQMIFLTLFRSPFPSMFGGEDEASRGIIPRALDEIFERISQDQTGSNFEVCLFPRATRTILSTA